MDKGFPGGSVVENPLANEGDARDAGLIPWVGKIPWRRKWQPTPVFLLEKSHGQRSLAGYSPKSRVQLSTHASYGRENKAAAGFRNPSTGRRVLLGAKN